MEARKIFRGEKLEVDKNVTGSVMYTRYIA
jgi:hypothetical protein